MMKHVFFFALFTPAAALADDVALDFDPPAEVGMFESARLIGGKGKIKGGTCEEAMSAAVEDALDIAARKDHPSVVAMYDDRPREGWASASSVTCEVKGKNAVVKVEALAVRPGTDPAYTPVSAERTTEIVDAFVTETSVIGMQVSSLNIEAYKGGLYYVTKTSREDMLSSADNRNDRAVVVYREDITPRLAYVTELVAPVPELSGVHITTSAKRIDKGEEQTDIYHLYATTDVAKAFVAGDITEQELVDQATFLVADGDSPPVKMDISFLDAED